MSEHTRTPGRIDEEATLVDGTANPSDSDSLGSEAKEAVATRGRGESREPGPVEDPSEAMPDELVSTPSIDITDRELHERSPWRFVFMVFSISVIVWLFYGVGSAIVGMWQQSFWFGFPLALLACIFLVALVIAIMREYRAMNAVDTLEDRRSRMHAAITSDNLPDLREILEPTLKNLRQRYSNRIAEFEEAAKTRETASDYLKQFENIVLIQLDKEASSAINRSAFTGGAAVAIIPHPALDAAVALWRATALIRKIGEIYGLEPTGLSSLRLLRHSIATAIIAAGSDIAAEVVVEQVGENAADKMFSVLGEGSIMAWRLYRLGNYAQKLCRPITS